MPKKRTFKWGPFFEMGIKPRLLHHDDAYGLSNGDLRVRFNCTTALYVSDEEHGGFGWRCRVTPGTILEVVASHMLRGATRFSDNTTWSSVIDGVPVSWFIEDG
jgi:hypothetical protein